MKKIGFNYLDCGQLNVTSTERRFEDLKMRKISVFPKIVAGMAVPYWKQH
jgi:hypothetical protein